MKWEVQQYTFCDGWVNTWTEDDIPVTFSTRSQAEKELQEYLDEVREVAARGDMLEEYYQDDFKVVPVLQFNDFGWIVISWMEDGFRKEFKLDDYDDAMVFVEELELKDLL
ncbi:MAG: hypothetical protein WA061_01745 [Microgenomates group bacterium]